MDARKVREWVCEHHEVQKADKMEIVIPFNESYLKSRYKMSDEFIDFLSVSVVPAVINRVSMQEKVGSVNLIGRNRISGLASISAKATKLSIHTEQIQTRLEVINHYLRSICSEEDVVIFLNPLFPFVKPSTLLDAYSKVVAGQASLAIGSFSNGILSEQQELDLQDLGVFTVLRKSSFIQNYDELPMPACTVKLTAIELISMRDQDDLELYNLIVNTGFAE